MCLPWSSEEEKLASSKLDMFFKPTESAPIRYDAW
jgi:hypothetical protein